MTAKHVCKYFKSFFLSTNIQNLPVFTQIQIWIFGTHPCLFVEIVYRIINVYEMYNFVCIEIECQIDLHPLLIKFSCSYDGAQ